MFKIEIKEKEMAVIYKDGIYKALENGKVFFQNNDYEKVRKAIFNKLEDFNNG